MPRPHHWIFVLGLTVVASPAGAQEARSTSLAGVAWLTGCWKQETGRDSTVEQWMAPAGGTMIGVNRTFRDGAVVAWEVLLLQALPGVLMYIASPSGQATTTFTGRVLGDSAFAVENRAHDFPQRIVYRRAGADSLVARIEGPGPDGDRGVDFQFRRVACADTAGAGQR